MKKLADFITVVGNLKNVPRYGSLLFAGIESDNVTEHSFSVAVFVMLLLKDFRKAGYEVNGEKLLACAITHDLAESVLGDIPSGSPSYRSFFEEDIRRIYKKALKKAENSINALLEEDLIVSENELSETEADILTIADICAFCYEIIEMKFSYKHDWVAKVWKNTVWRLDSYSEKYVFLRDYIDELQKMYAAENKPVNPLLTREQYNK